MKILVYNIKYDGRSSIISITGSNALQNFVEKGYVNSYDANCAPTSIDLDLNMTLDELTSVDGDKYIKAKAEEELGLTIKSFDYTFLQ